MPHDGECRRGERVFVGVLLDGEARQRFADWQQKNRALFGIRWKQRKKLHVTLFASDRYTDADLLLLGNAAAKAAHHVAAFISSVHPRVSWFAPRVRGGDHILIARPSLSQPYRMLHDAIKKQYGSIRKGRRMRFVPHVTLGKSRRIVPRNSLSPLPQIRIRAARLAIVITQQGPHHDEYRIWKRIPLASKS